MAVASPPALSRREGAGVRKANRSKEMNEKLNNI